MEVIKVGEILHFPSHMKQELLTVYNFMIPSNYLNQVQYKAAEKGQCLHSELFYVTALWDKCHMSLECSNFITCIHVGHILRTYPECDIRE